MPKDLLERLENKIQKVLQDYALVKSEMDDLRAQNQILHQEKQVLIDKLQKIIDKLEILDSEEV